MHQPQAQDDVWGRNPDALCASSFPTQGGSGRYVDGGVVLDGIWSAGRTPVPAASGRTSAAAR